MSPPDLAALMREQTSIPQWALEHMRGQLGPQDEVINAVAFRHGLFQGLVLLNTSRGAALVTKSLTGAPRSALLAYPRDLLTFQCTACSERNVLVGGKTPEQAYCMHCGTQNRLEPGDAGEQRTIRTGSASKRSPRQAAKEGPAKRSATAPKKAAKTAKKPSGKQDNRAAKKTATRGGPRRKA